MPDIKAIRAYRYDPQVAGPVDTLVSPPYDVITPDQQNALYEKNEFNSVRIELTRAEPGAASADSKYEEAAETLANWLRKGVLRQDAEPALYLYSQTFEALGKKRTRRGVLCGLKLEPLGQGKVLPHERTLAKAKTDRLKLIRKVSANLSPVFGLYRDPGDELLENLFSAAPQAGTAFVDASGVSHDLRVLTQAQAIAHFSQAMRDLTVYIADGHHRYEVGLEYAAERRAQAGGAETPADFILMMLVNLDAPGLAVLPTHRLLRKGSTRLNAEELAADFTVLSADLRTMEKLAGGEMNPKAIGWFDGQVYRLLTPKMPETASRHAAPGESEARRNLSVSILHNAILRNRLGVDTLLPEGQDRMKYIVATQDVVKAMQGGEYQDAFFLAPTSVFEVCSVAESGDVMPQKSTFFFPKLLTGLVFNPLT